MDILNPNLQWLLTEFLSDGPLAIISNLSRKTNRSIYFNQKSMNRIEKLLNSKIIEYLERYKELVLIMGPSSLQELDLSEYGMDDKGAKYLAEALKINTSLQELDFRINQIGEKGAKYLAEELKVNTSLQKLSLGDNEIGDEGAKYLAEALEVNSSLKYLNLGDNQIGDEGVKYLDEALKINTSLQLLSLDKDEGVKSWVEYFFKTKTFG